MFVITAKHHDTFEQKPVDSICATAQEFFDLAVEDADLKASYSEDVRRLRSLLALAYQKLASARPTLTVRFIYTSRGDSSTVAESVRNRSNQAVSIVKELFSSSECSFTFIGASELVTKHRKEKAFSISLPVNESLTSSQNAHVVLARIDDYAQFVTDDNGKLRRYLFDSNVRDFLGKSRVNIDIMESLNDPVAAEFWWLNNGVTILTTNATMVGKKLQLDNIQIVNGLQTTESIFQYRQSSDFVSSNRCVLVKVLVSTDPLHRDQIIRATNNQNVVEHAGLRATDKIQRDIEEYLDHFSWYYERRKNYYKNVGKPQMRFVSVLYLAAAYTALVRKLPARAARQRSKFVRNDLSYHDTFSEDTPLRCWLVITEVFKRADVYLQRLENQYKFGNKFVSRWRPLLAFLAASNELGRYSYDKKALSELDFENITQRSSILHGESSQHR